LKGKIISLADSPKCDFDAIRAIAFFTEKPTIPEMPLIV
jgi:hypothetical protein